MEKSLIDRYSPNIILKEIGGSGQNKLLQSKVLIVGAGGLGSPVISYLAASGVGIIGISDHDVVSNSNLQRQIIYKTKDVGKSKALCAKKFAQKLNPNIKIIGIPHSISENNAVHIVRDYDFVIDGSDNLSTRYLLNKVCYAHNKAFLIGAISQWDGQIGLYDPNKGSPCFNCVFPNSETYNNLEGCSEGGVLGPLPGIVGSIMAAEAIKYLLDIGNSLIGSIILFDCLSSEVRKYQTKRRQNCLICDDK
ncbi:MAG: HesA/MoeB/ThiF family protein [Pseudomonadota bacterium]|nr:HesA/MoeB/ThiF family protein [Pseudomonadota bacterium]